MAQGYFAHNLATELAPNEQARRELVWFPEEGKEPHLQDRREFSGRFPPTALNERGRVQTRGPAMSGRHELVFDNIFAQKDAKSKIYRFERRVIDFNATGSTNPT